MSNNRFPDDESNNDDLPPLSHEILALRPRDRAATPFPVEQKPDIPDGMTEAKDADGDVYMADQDEYSPRTPRR